MNNQSQRGFVLPMTLIILAMLTVLSMGLSKMARSNLSDAQQRTEMLQRELHYKNTEQWVVYQLLTGIPDKTGRSLAGEHLLLNGTKMLHDGLSISVQDGAGLLGLGIYDQQVFKRLVASFTDKKTAQKIAAQLGDWVDSDHLPRYQGMEVADYLQRGLPMLPRNAPIRSLQELLELPAMTEKILYGDARHAGLSGLLLAGGEGHFNVATAPQILLDPVLGYSGAKLQQLLELRQQGDWSALQRMLQTHRLFFDHSPFEQGTTFRLRIADDSGFSVLALLSVMPSKTMPYVRVLWQYPRHDW